MPENPKDISAWHHLISRLLPASAVQISSFPPSFLSLPSPVYNLGDHLNLRSPSTSHVLSHSASKFLVRLFTKYLFSSTSPLLLSSFTHSPLLINSGGSSPLCRSIMENISPSLILILPATENPYLKPPQPPLRRPPLPSLLLPPQAANRPDNHHQRISLFQLIAAIV